MESPHKALRAEAGAALALIALSFAVALRRPLFHDEASTWYFCREGLPGLVVALRADVHPPGWFLLALGWFSAAGDRVEGLRAFSCLAMGAALLLFLRAWRRAFPGSDSVALAWLLGTSPLLAFAGSFARYYAFAGLAVAGPVWALARLKEAPSAGRAAAAGAMAGLCAYVNYAAAFVAGPMGLLAVVLVAKARGWRMPAVYIASAAAVTLPLLPLLLEQLGGATRVGGDAGGLARGAILNGAYLVYAMAAGDGLPPQFGAGAAMAALEGIVALAVFIRLRRDRGEAAAAALLAVVVLGLAVVLGALTFPGPLFIFLPPRVAFAAFAWGVLLAGIPGTFAPSRRLIAVVVAGNLLSLGASIGPGLTTNWAYRLPLAEIADEVGTEMAGRGLPATGAGAAVYLPERSLANVRLVLERRFPGLQINRSAAEAKLLLTLDEMRDAGGQLARAEADGWPPTAPVLREASLLEEDAATRWLKETLLRRPVAKAKLRLTAVARE